MSQRGRVKLFQISDSATRQVFTVTPSDHFAATFSASGHLLKMLSSSGSIFFLQQTLNKGLNMLPSVGFVAVFQCFFFYHARLFVWL